MKTIQQLHEEAINKATMLRGYYVKLYSRINGDFESAYVAQWRENSALLECYFSNKPDKMVEKSYDSINRALEQGILDGAIIAYSRC